MRGHKARPACLWFGLVLAPWRAGAARLTAGFISPPNPENSRVNKQHFIFGYLAIASQTSLFARPSTPGAHAYGPNPFEVSP